ncbi:MAG TPA: 30S ribosomal protein S6 [Candidatus Bathyarchaeia archaeon]|nr:30S ribosomal protein S6 [Candidatus Bathyarchaeia archaeon]
MKTYELVLVFNPEIGEDKIKQNLESINKTIASLKGEVKKTVAWGRRELAYSIKKINQGSYFLLVINLPPDAPREIGKKLKLNSDLIRYLLVSCKDLIGG